MQKKIIFSIIIVFFILQFFKPEKNNTSINQSHDISSMIEMPENIKSILNNSCYDCHSNQSKYPWYFNIQPVGWFLNHHIQEGKHHLNFNEFATYSTSVQNKKLDEISEEISEHEMPLTSYKLLHGYAKLSNQDEKELITWIQKLKTKIAIKSAL